MPARVVTDNGTNLVGAANRLGNLKFELNCKKIKQAVPDVEWNFTTPHCPHSGGFFERMVQSMKSALHKIIGGHLNPSIEYFITALYQAADVINSRPLTYVSDDVKDPQPITPNHFLRMWSAIEAPVCPGVWFDQVYRKLGRIMADLKRQFALELIPTLHEYPKGWRSPKKDFKVGEIVLLIEANHVGTWPLARITQVYPGADGRVRHVDLEVFLPKNIGKVQPVKDESKLRWRSRKCGNACDFYKTILKRDVRRIVRLHVEEDGDNAQELDNIGQNQIGDPDSGDLSNFGQVKHPDITSEKGAKADLGALVGRSGSTSKVKVGCTCQYRRLTFEKWIEFSQRSPCAFSCLATGERHLEAKNEVNPMEPTMAVTATTLLASDTFPSTSLNSEKNKLPLKTWVTNDTLCQNLPVIKVTPAENPVETGIPGIQESRETSFNALNCFQSEPRLICVRVQSSKIGTLN